MYKYVAYDANKQISVYKDPSAYAYALEHGKFKSTTDVDNYLLAQSKKKTAKAPKPKKVEADG